MNSTLELARELGMEHSELVSGWRRLFGDGMWVV